MPDFDQRRVVAALLGADPGDVPAARTYGALPPADAPPARQPVAVTLDPDVSDDEFNAFTATFDLAGADDGPLAGLDVAVKDNVAVAGVPLTAGASAFADAEPGRHAPVVDRLLDAGATVTGKTNMDELAYGPTGETGGFGPTRNPRGDAHVAGGSSAGSGAAVAAGVADAALGTDTGGSVRIPASFCGVVGYKPSFGAVPRAGVVPLAASLDQVGVLAASVETAAAVADAVAGSHPLDPATAGRSPGALADAAGAPPAVADCSFGLAEEFLGEHVGPAVRGRVERAADALEAAGATVEHVSVPRFDETAYAWDAVANVEFAAAVAAGFAPLGGVSVDDAWHRAAAAALADGDASFYDRVVENALDGAALLAASGGSVYDRALAEVRRFADGYRTALGDHDALLAPTMPVTAPAVGEWPLSAAERSARDFDGPPLSVNVRQANLVGAPAVSVPCGRVRGLPVGLQLLGEPGRDEAVLAAASAVEAVVA
ncbi:amidase [Halobacterium yunchengense]|uniref:amidase n=1 Tax=Halobacterium yunchengense TaxID=3108497 RepID=UPI00300A02BE